jgi:hypothetical protein
MARCDDTCTADCGRCKGTGFGRGDRVSIAPVYGESATPATVILTYVSGDGWDWARVRPDGDSDIYVVRINRLTHLEA